MKRWLLVLSALALLGVPGTLFLANTLMVSNDVRVTAVVGSPGEEEETAPVIIPTSSGGGGGGAGGGSHSSSFGNADDDKEIDNELDGDAEGISGEQENTADTNTGAEPESSADTTQTTNEVAVEQTPTTSIYFGGYAFPNASVTFMIDGEESISILADTQGYFEGVYSGLVFGEHVFSFQAESYEGDESRLVSYAYSVQNESPLYISSVLLPPIFTPGDTGDSLTGVAIPGSQIEVYGVSQNGQSLVLLETIEVPATGAYDYSVDLKTGTYSQYYVSCNFKGQACGYSGIVPVQTIGSEYVVPTNIFADFTSDVKVNYVDFSFMRAAFLSDVSILFYDLDEDGVLTMKDFSLLNYQWTQ